MIVRLAGLLLCLTACASPAVGGQPALYGYSVVQSFPHDPAAFTEGLFYRDGALYESTGLERHSNVRIVRLETGEVLRQIDLDPDYFGEGVVDWKDRLIQLTWKSGLGFVRDLHRGRAGIAVTGNDMAAKPLGRDHKFTAQLARAKQEYLCSWCHL